MAYTEFLYKRKKDSQSVPSHFSPNKRPLSYPPKLDQS